LTTFTTLLMRKFTAISANRKFPILQQQFY
jgi:hypothetical protein